MPSKGSASTGSVLEFRISPLLLPLSFQIRLVLIRLQPVLPYALAHVAGALQVQTLGDPVLPFGGALADRPGDRHFAPVALGGPFLRRFVEIEMLQPVGEDASGLRLGSRDLVESADKSLRPFEIVPA